MVYIQIMHGRLWQNSQKFKRSLPTLGAALLLVFTPHSLTAAESWEEVKNLSSVDGISKKTLLSGSFQTARTPLPDIPELMAVEMLFVVKGTPEQVATNLRNWDASQHKGLDIKTHHILSTPVKPGDLYTFNIDPKQGYFSRLFSESQQIKPGRGDFQLSKREGAIFEPQKEAFKKAKTPEERVQLLQSLWGGVLYSRAFQQQTRGFEAAAPYESSGKPVKPSAKILKVSKQLPLIGIHFKPVVQATFAPMPLLTELTKKNKSPTSEEPPSSEEQDESEALPTEKSPETLLPSSVESTSTETPLTNKTPSTPVEEVTKETPTAKPEGPAEVNKEIDTTASMPTPDSNTEREKPALKTPGVDTPFIQYYADLIAVRNNTTFVLGLTADKKHKDGWQMADLQYYVSSDYEASLTCLHFWPITDPKDSTPKTLVFRADYIILPDYIPRHSIAGMAGDNILLQEVRNAMQKFRKDAEKGP